MRFSTTHATDHAPLIAVLQDARALLARPENNFDWSTWDNSAEALREVDTLIEALKSGQRPPRAKLDILFLPTGPIQEVSLSSGWGDHFLEVANRFDAAMSALYGPHPRDHAAVKAELDGYVQQLFTDGMRWFSTGMAVVAIGYSIYLHLTHDTVEVYFPLRLKGESVFYPIVLGVVVFGTIAVLNWIIWFRKRRPH